MEALKQCVQLLLRRSHIGVAHVARRRLVLHGFGQLVQLALVQLVDGLAEQVVVAAHPLVACVQVALAVLGCAFFTRVGEELLGQRPGRGADALGEDGVGRQHPRRCALGDGVDGPRALGHPGALVEDLGHGACPCRRVAHLAVLEGVQQVHRALVVAHHLEHPAQELAYLVHQCGAWGVRQAQLASHGELVDVGQALLAVDELLQGRWFVLEQGLQSAQHTLVVGQAGEHLYGLGVGLDELAEERMQCLVAGHVHHTSVGQGADLDQVVSLDELARVPGDVLELSLDLFAQHAVEVFTGCLQVSVGGHALGRTGLRAVLPVLEVVGFLLVEVDVVGADLAVVVDHVVGRLAVAPVGGCVLVTQDAQALEVVGCGGLGAEAFGEEPVDAFARGAAHFFRGVV